MINQNLFECLETSQRAEKSKYYLLLSYLHDGDKLSKVIIKLNWEVSDRNVSFKISNQSASWSHIAESIPIIISVDRLIRVGKCEWAREWKRELLQISSMLSLVFFLSSIFVFSFQRFSRIIWQAGCQNDHPSMSMFLQLHHLLSTYKNDQVT